jgi:energy-coupling factor transporter ATP-binding protein EcfA2
MASTTGTKKELVDFLWDWAESNGEWSKLLVSKIVTTETNLTQQERQIIFDHFLQSIGLKSGLSVQNIIKPTFAPTSKNIKLKSLSEVKGVNKLAENQEILFSENVTVIYGENGTGKTGYGRILKSLGFSYETQNIIHSNIYASAITKSACIKYTADNNPETFNWDGSTSNSDLETISVFNNNCVQISLSDGRELIVSPIGFHLFNLVSSELTELTNILNTTIGNHPTQLAWNVNLKQGTPQFSFISTLKANSTEQNLTLISEFKPEPEQVIIDKEKELKDLNKSLLENELKSYNAQISEINSLTLKIQTAEKKITSKSWQDLINFNTQIAELEKKTQKGIKEVAEANGINFYQTKEFQSFIKSAEQYIKLLEKPNYPNDKDEICVYCRQPLETDETKTLLANYRQLLNDTTQEELKKLKESKKNLIEQISQVDASLTFHQQTFGTDNKNQILQPKEITEYNKALNVFKTSVASDNIDSQVKFNIDYPSTLKFLTDKKSALQIIADNKINAISTLATQEKALQAVIDELKDRRLLSTKINEVKKAINNLKIVSKLESKRNSFSTNSISRKTTEAREELVKQNFIELFNEELKSLRKSQIQVELNFGTVKGHSKVQQKLNTSYSLAEILSEGEQKAIALAEFLTELQLDNSKSPVIFDDPVNSLDHNIIDDVSRRLIKLSRERQVVIFTHSVLLFNSILYFSKQPSYKTLEYKFFNSKNDFGKTGFISEAEEEINSVKSYLKKIEPLLNNTPKDQNESDVASDGYGYLRSAIELCVEHEIFQGTIKRYQKNVALTSFVKVNGDLLNQHKDKLNEIFERSCGYIKGHSNPTEIYNDPTLEELKADFNEFKAIRTVFAN